MIVKTCFIHLCSFFNPCSLRQVTEVDPADASLFFILILCSLCSQMRSAEVKWVTAALSKEDWEFSLCPSLMNSLICFLWFKRGGKKTELISVDAAKEKLDVVLRLVAPLTRGIFIICPHSNLPHPRLHAALLRQFSCLLKQETLFGEVILWC